MFDLGRMTYDLQCTKCGFYNRIFLKQIKLRDVVICRGCKVNLCLDDHMNEYRKIERKTNKQIKEMFSGLDGLTLEINL